MGVLHLDLRERGAVGPALERALREALGDGRLAVGDPLPSTRALAQDLRLARGTVGAAYARLADEGWLSTRQGAPTRVAALPSRPIARGRRVRSEDPVPAAPARAAPRAVRADLRPCVPDVSRFPAAAWLAAGRRALRRARFDVLAYGDPLGRVELRDALARHLRRTRGVIAPAEDVVVTSGFAGALALLGQALVGLGIRSVALEDPCYARHRDILAAAGLRVVPVPVDAGGVDVDALEATGAAAALVTPAHQLPVGVTLHPGRRQALARWAREGGRVLIEDDYDGEYRFDRRPVGALQALAPEAIVYAGTASKMLAPAMRIGWLVVPPRLRTALAAQMVAEVVPALDQLALAELIAGGALDAHVRRGRAAYRARHRRLVASLSSGPYRLAGIAAGLHALLPLPDLATERALVAAGARSGLSLAGLEPYWHGRPRGAGLVVGYARPFAHAADEAFAALAELLARPADAP